MEIAPGLYSIGQLQGIRVHAFLVDDGNGLTLVDTLYATDAGPILAELQRMGKSPVDIKRILLTHAHRAHLGGLARLQALSGAPVHCHAWEADIVAGERKAQSMTLRPMKPWVVYPFQIAARFGSHPPAAVDHFLEDGDQVGSLQVIHAPGHTPGHLAFYWPARRALFAGDALVTWPTFDSGWPGFMLNLKQQERTLQRLASLDIEILAVGHGDPMRSNANTLMRGWWTA